MQALAIYHHYSRRSFVLLACLCAVLAFMYGLFLIMAVGHTASRAKAGEAVTELKSKLSDVESTYLAATQSLTPARAASLGFVPPSTVSTVYATDVARVLTLKTGDKGSIGQ